MNAQDRRDRHEYRLSRRRTRFVYVEEDAIPTTERPCGCMPFGTHALASGVRVYSKSTSLAGYKEDDAEECKVCGASWRFADRMPPREAR
jgi:hypothetical protein